jgi:RNA polymerase sigma factor (sigma-70 family)
MLAEHLTSTQISSPHPALLGFGQTQQAKLVTCAASQLLPRRGWLLERRDLVSAGFAGLLEAAQRFRPEYGASFPTFAYPRVLGAMRDEIRATYPRRRAGVELADLVEDPTPAADDMLAAHEVIAALARTLDTLPARERQLIERCFFEGATLEQASGELGLSKSRGSRLRARALRALRAAVEEVIEG